MLASIVTTKTVAVVGLGYVGLPLASIWQKNEYNWI